MTRPWITKFLLLPTFFKNISYHHSNQNHPSQNQPNQNQHTTNQAKPNTVRFDEGIMVAFTLLKQFKDEGELESTPDLADQLELVKKQH